MVKKLRILICGDREWYEYNIIKDTLLEVINNDINNVECIIQGCARGADLMGKKVAFEIGIPKEKILDFPANWGKHHRAAGPIRNQQMIDEGKPNTVLAFHHNISKSKGTKDILRRSLNKLNDGIDKIKLISFDNKRSNLTMI